MKVPILSGIYTDASPAPRVSLPVNMVPVPGANGVSDGHLRPADGIVTFATGQGVDRGGIVWLKDGVHYRVSGQKLISIDAVGSVAVLGDVPGVDLVRLDYSFDRLFIAANGQLRYWDGATLTLVVDANAGTVNDALFIDGYSAVTDSKTIAVSNLTDPTTFNPLHYFSSEADPDAIQCLLKVQNELHAVNRNTIEVFQNVGGDFAPFSRVSGALISKGAVGRRAACVFGDFVAFVGGARNEDPVVWLGRNAQTLKISTREVDKLLAGLTEAQLAAVVVEAVVGLGGQFLHVRLPDRTMVYDAIASASSVEKPSGEPHVWHTLTGTAVGDTFAQYRACNFVLAHGAWIVGDPQSSAIGLMSASEPQHWGADFRWEFGTLMLRNGGKGALIRQLELVALTGAVPAGEDSMITTSYSKDGRVWSLPRAIRSGKIGDTARRLIWLLNGDLRSWRVQRFRGDSGSRIAALCLEVDVEGLAY